MGPLDRRWLAIAAGSGLFALIAIFVRLGSAAAFDRAISLAMRNPGDLSMAGPPWLNHGAREITALGSTTIVFLIVAVASIFSAVCRRGREALRLWACVVTGDVLMNVLKALFARPRPELVPHSVNVTGSSFPSGHAMLSAVAYLAIAFLTMPRRPLPAVRKVMWSIALLLVLMIGLTRVYLGVHWPTDVIAGWIAGGVWAMIWTITLPVAVEKRSDHHS